MHHLNKEASVGGLAEMQKGRVHKRGPYNFNVAHSK